MKLYNVLFRKSVLRNILFFILLVAMQSCELFKKDNTCSGEWDEDSLFMRKIVVTNATGYDLTIDINSVVIKYTDDASHDFVRIIKSNETDTVTIGVCVVKPDLVTDDLLKEYDRLDLTGNKYGCQPDGTPSPLPYLEATPYTTQTIPDGTEKIFLTSWIDGYNDYSVDSLEITVHHQNTYTTLKGWEKTHYDDGDGIYGLGIWAKNWERKSDWGWLSFDVLNININGDTTDDISIQPVVLKR